MTDVQQLAEAQTGGQGGGPSPKPCRLCDKAPRAHKIVLREEEGIGFTIMGVCLSCLEEVWPSGRVLFVDSACTWAMGLDEWKARRRGPDCPDR